MGVNRSLVGVSQRLSFMNAFLPLFDFRHFGSDLFCLVLIKKNRFCAHFVCLLSPVTL